MMPASSAILAAVAAHIGGVATGDAEAVARFYRVSFPRLPEPARALIAEFLMAATELPSSEILSQLADAIRQPEVLPAANVPAWPGAPMAYHAYEAVAYAAPRAATGGAAPGSPIATPGPQPSGGSVHQIEG